jgi:para-nitrobenzyl esterase
MADAGRRPTATTTSGEVVGLWASGVRTFKGIPFAQPPVGALRFRPPRPPVPWSAPRDAADFGPGPVQPAHPMIQIPSGTSEDCLTLNVWAPADPGPHPVIFAIYGGGNFLGASSQHGYDGASFAARGLVFVSANYRVGALGFLELGGIDPDFAGSSLNGLRDIEAALCWVRDNIAAFGGDPGQVSLIGQSAGAKNECALAAMPSARGLFQRLAVQSGGGHTVFRSLEEATPVARALLQAAGIDGPAAAGLQALPVDALLAAQNKTLEGTALGFPFRPTVDGATLPMAPIEAARAGATRALDLVIGVARDEAALALETGDPPFEARALANLSLEAMQALETRYVRQFPELSPKARRIRQLTAEEYWMPSVRFAEAHARAGGRTWMYRFDLPAPAGPFAGYAMHGADAAYVYGHRREATAEAAGIHDLWADWARTGLLRQPGGPDWPPYDERERLTFVFDQPNRVEADPRGDERRLWDGLL